MTAPETPELDKISAIADESHKLGEFLDWLEGERRLSLARWSSSDGQLVPDYTPKEQLLAAYFGINLAVADVERGEVLRHLRTMNASQP